MSKSIGFDPGTAFFQVAEQDIAGKIKFKTIRNAFVELSGYENSDIEQILKQNKWQYVSDGSSYFVIGEDSLKLARIFPKIEVRRPMQNGVLSKGEDKKMLIMASMIENAIGKAEDKESVVCYCISSPVIDSQVDSIFHKNRMEGMIKRMGYKTKCIDEAMGIILSQRPCLTIEEEEIPYSGLAISFGAGRTNAVLAYRGLQVIGMSCNRGGDYIDAKVAEQTDFPISRISHIKETKLDFDNLDVDDDIIFAIDCYYQNLIEYIFINFAKKFKEIKSEFLDVPITIILAGGTSMPPGFCKKVKSVVNNINLPFKIKEIVHAKDPKNAVVQGLLTQAIISQKKIQKTEKDNIFED